MNRKGDLVNFLIATLFLLSLSLPGSVFAQQDPQFTQYLSAGNFFNPAFAGKDIGNQFSAFHRSQWQGYSSTSGIGVPPITQLITLQGRIKAKKFWIWSYGSQR